VRQRVNDSGQAEPEPCQEITPADVTDTNPDDSWAIGRPGASDRKILILRDDDSSHRDRVGPHSPIIGICHTQIEDVLGNMALLDQPPSQGRRKLRVDEESHSVGA
jgi:hypothetical protein